ncbi:MAG: preprotein translocase [Oleiphilus sp.]|nr:MAG: preprotein translocase [Oleiphilus sp.]
MRREKFTVPRLNKYECEPGKSQTIYWDSVSTNLGLRVTKAGKKSYVFESSLGGNTIRITIGAFDAVKIDDARAEANELKSQINKGFDPRQIKKENEAKAVAVRVEEKKKQLLVSDAWADYLKLHAKVWGERHYQDHLNLSGKGGEKKKRGKGLTVRGVLYPLLSLRMSEVNAERLKAWQESEAKSRANNARQGFELFRAFWRWCYQSPDYAFLIDPLAVENKDLRKKVPARKSKKFDVLERAHMKDWFEAVRSLSNPVQSVYLQALILTGARRGEIAALKWSDVDFRWSSIWVKDKVHEEGRKIPLTPYLKACIESLPRRNEWVFSSVGSQSGRIAEPRIAHNRALEKAGLHHVTLHGLRRTFASLAEWVEMPSGIVAQIQGHAPNATAERHYINRPLELLAVWHTKYEKWILEQAGVYFDYDDQTEGLKVVS